MPDAQLTRKGDTRVDIVEDLLDREYNYRWKIESGYENIKRFMADEGD